MENKYHAYGLNSSACQEVVKMLGGIGDTTGVANGFVGTETVAVGLTVENMKKYGLFAHTVYFELPRGIIVLDSGDEDTIDDYTWYETLGFTLYISEVQPDGTRYVGSDLYDIVAKVPAENLVFLDHDFVNFWARRNLMLIDIEAMERFEVDFTMSDLKGGYDFDLYHRDLYIDAEGNGTFQKPENFAGTPYNYIDINVKKECLCGKKPCECTLTVFDRYLRENRYANATLAEVYNYNYTGNKDTNIYIGNDTYGTAYYKEVMELLYLTQYEGSLTAEEQEAGLLSGNLLMSFKVTLRAGEYPNASAYPYNYEFYRIDDRRVMVRLYQSATDGHAVTPPVSDFYISSFAFKKIVTGFISLLNTEELDPEAAYPDIFY
jgi:hypothetical protein